jgi:hypothetical protein
VHVLALVLLVVLIAICLRDRSTGLLLHKYCLEEKKKNDCV